MPTPPSAHRRRAASLSPARLALVVALAVTLAASCGIDVDKMASGNSASSSSTIAASTTSTSDPNDPGFTLPPVSQGDPGTTTSTEPSSTESSTTSGGGETTPHGRTPENVRASLQQLPGITPAIAGCISEQLFSVFSGEDIDSVLEAQSMDELDPDLAARFVDILRTCRG